MKHRSIDNIVIFVLTKGIYLKYIYISAPAWGNNWIFVSFLKVDKKKKEKKDKERENEKEKNALTKDKVQKKRQTTSPTTTTQRSRPETRYHTNCPLPALHTNRLKIEQRFYVLIYLFYLFLFIIFT